MKICVICPEIGNSGGNAFIGGHVNNVVRLSKVLSDRGHEITVVTTPQRYSNNQSEQHLELMEVYCLPISSSYSPLRYGLGFAFKAIRKIKELHKYKKFDIIHGHSGCSILALITSISAKITGLPSIHSIYCPMQIANKDVVELFSNRILSKLYFSQIDKIIAVTGNVRNSLIKAGILGDKIIEIPSGINTELYNSEILGDEVRKRYNINPDQPTLIYVGNLTLHKGLPVLIEALNKVANEIPNIKLLMVLSIPLERYAKPDKLDVNMDLIFKIKEKIKHYGLEDNVIPLGLLDNMPQVMAASDVFILPFLDTASIVDHPTSLLEAMAIGKPVIVTRVGGILEIIKHNKNGMLVEPNNIDELVSAIIYMLNNKEEAKNMGRKGATLISEKFKIEIVVDELERISEEVISNYSGNRRY